MDARDLRHAYAVLELSPPVSEARLKQRYKTLVRRWHPDRYQADSVGQAEAAQKLRDINVAYQTVARSLESTEPSRDSSVGLTADRPFSWSPERVEAVAESINRLNRLSLVPEMSLDRWLSIAAVALYVLVASVLLPAHFGQGKRELVRALALASAYFWLPLYLSGPQVGMILASCRVYFIESADGCY